tara:strand:- start:11871 stop:12668 length:798 start_codon:yes stop_codon:yes gene_type:complete
MILHFAHANGFPASSYQELFKHLKPNFKVGYIDCIGHNPEYPITDGWSHLVEELIDHIKTQYNEPVVGVGHSLGGMLTFMAAQQQPELFKSIILLDPPLYGYVKSSALRFGKVFNFIDRIVPGGNAERRRKHWSSEQGMVEYFQNKKLFQDITPQCLRDYAKYGTVPNDEGGVDLKFDPVIEQSIAVHIPHTRLRVSPEFDLPFGFFHGKDSGVIKPYDVTVLRRLFKARTKTIPGSHLFPFEYPRATAKAIVNFVEKYNFNTKA